MVSEQRSGVIKSYNANEYFVDTIKTKESDIDWLKKLQIASLGGVILLYHLQETLRNSESKE